MLKLLHVLWGRTAGACFKETTAVQQRYDRKHLGAGVQLKNREKVGEVIAHDVTCYRNRVFARFDAFKRELHRVDERLDMNLKP